MSEQQYNDNVAKNKWQQQEIIKQECYIEMEYQNNNKMKSRKNIVNSLTYRLDVVLVCCFICLTSSTSSSNNWIVAAFTSSQEVIKTTLNNDYSIHPISLCRRSSCIARRRDDNSQQQRYTNHFLKINDLEEDDDNITSDNSKPHDNNNIQSNNGTEFLNDNNPTISNHNHNNNMQHKRDNKNFKNGFGKATRRNDESHKKAYPKKSIQQHQQRSPTSRSTTTISTNNKDSTTGMIDLTTTINPSQQHQHQHQHKSELEIQQLMNRISQLENMVSSHQVIIRKLSEQCRELTESTKAFQNLMDLLKTAANTKTESDVHNVDIENNDIDDIDDDDKNMTNLISNKFNNEYKDVIVSSTSLRKQKLNSNNADSSTTSFEDDVVSIFGTAPETVLDAADVAGASILSGILAGKQRMLVDVRDAELQSNSETFVQFLELAVLPVAAGLEGLHGPRNRLKLVFPTVSELLQYRKTMCLSAPEVVTLSTLGFDPVESHDNVIVIIAPSPDDVDGLTKMNELLQLPPINDNYDNEYDEDGRRRNKGISKPVIVLNRHMLPITGPASTFEVAYHLRLLSVRYISGNGISSPPLPQLDDDDDNNNNNNNDSEQEPTTSSIVDETTASTSSSSTTTTVTPNASTVMDYNINENLDGNDTTRSIDALYNETSSSSFDDHEEEVEAVLRKHEYYENSKSELFRKSASTSTSTSLPLFGITRAMVIRAYPHSWNVFVDTSPDDTTADFEVAAVFDNEPSTHEIHNAIVTCLEGSEQEDDIVAHQMQQALEAGQLDRITEFLASIGDDDNDNNIHDDDEEEDDDEDPYKSFFGQDSV